MHSSDLKSTDFEIIDHGNPVSHHQFFQNHTTERRIGVVAPHRIDAVGAACIIMAHTTAFYDRYREKHEAFFAYPDYFVFQGQEPQACYGMLDIWPEHKSVAINGNHSTRLNAINDRAVNILILPEGHGVKKNYEKPQLESARRNIKECFIYSETGQCQNADTLIRCQKEPIYSWTLAVIDSLIKNGDESAMKFRTEWEKLHEKSDSLEQSYRRISLDQALALL